MPREVVHTSIDGPYLAKVGWQADRHVQLGVEGDEGRSLNWLLHQDRAETIGDATLQMVRDMVKARGKDTPDEAFNRAVGEGVLDLLDTNGGDYRGVWTNLDREGCNRLIRLLRRARDAAFGADA